MTKGGGFIKHSSFKWLLLYIWIGMQTFAFQHPINKMLAHHQRIEENHSSSKPLIHDGLVNHLQLRKVVKTRGGERIKTSATSPALKDCTAAASAFFGGIRIPASLIAGASLAQMFALAKRTKDLEFSSKAERFLIISHNVCMLLSFCFTMCTVVIGTAASTSVLHGSFNPMAQNSYYFLNRELPFEFITCRLSFLTGTFLFLLAVTERVFLEYDLLRSNKRDNAIAVGTGMISLLTFLMSYINTTLHCWPNIFSMCLEFFKIAWKRGFSNKLPLQMMSSVFAVIGILFAGKVLLKEISQ